MEQKLFDAAADLPKATLAFDEIESQPRTPGLLKRRHRAWTIAAGLLLAVCIGFGSFAIAAEAAEYRNAVAFFDDHALSTEGLTREEIKAVYRDITEETFSNPKTAEIILNKYLHQVGGFEIPQEIPTPNKVADLWNSLNGTVQLPAMPQPQPPQGIRYAYRNAYNPDNALDFQIAYLEKYDGETLLWRVSPEADSIIYAYQPVSDGVFIWGTKESLYHRKAWLAKIDNDGKLLWQRQLQHGFQDENITHILENDDGSFAVISRGNWDTLCLSQYISDGTERSSLQTQVGNYGFGVAAKMAEGYALQLFSYTKNEYSKILKLDTEGNITDTFIYESSEVDYHITDMMEHNGTLYLSTYAVPKATDEGGRHEISGILDYIHAQDRWSFSSEELTPVVRDNYTAVLLVCDPVSGTPKTFFSVEGSLGGKLACGDAGRLLWDVESITSTFFSPATSAFSIGGSCTVYRYAFDGTSVSQWKTGEFTAYLR